jgi:hypothetical protein
MQAQIDEESRKFVAMGFYPEVVKSDQEEEYAWLYDLAPISAGSPQVGSPPAASSSRSAAPPSNAHGAYSHNHYSAGYRNHGGYEGTYQAPNGGYSSALVTDDAEIERQRDERWKGYEERIKSLEDFWRSRSR